MSELLHSNVHVGSCYTAGLKHKSSTGNSASATVGRSDDSAPSLPPKKRMRFSPSDYDSRTPSFADDELPPPSPFRSDSSLSTMSTSSRESGATDPPTLGSEDTIEETKLKRTSTEEEEVGLLMLRLRNGSVVVPRGKRGKASRKRKSARASRKRKPTTPGDAALVTDVDGNRMAMGYFSKAFGEDEGDHDSPGDDDEEARVEEGAAAAPRAGRARVPPARDAPTVHDPVAAAARSLLYRAYLQALNQAAGHCSMQ